MSTDARPFALGLSQYGQKELPKVVVSRAKSPSPLERLPSMSFDLPQETGNRGILVYDAGGRIACADPSVFALLGISPQDIPTGATEKNVHDILSRCFTDTDDYSSNCRRLRENPQSTFEDVLHTRVAHHAIHRYTSPLFDQDGRCLGRAEVYSDITKRRAMEQAARVAWEELRTTQEQLVQSEKLRAVGEIASGVAHDFNNTLGVILGNIQLLLRTVKDEDTRVRLLAAERAALDGADTVRRIQEFTRKKAEIATSPLSLASLASEVVEMMRPVWQEGAQAQGRPIQMNVDCAEDAIVSANGAEVREVLMNILLNAIQAMPAGGAISVSNGKVQDEGYIQIADTGIGMSEEVKGRVFDPFFTTRGVEGTGLGMSIAYGIIRRHGGSISIDSEVGKGTSVTVFLPAVSGEPEATQTEQGFDPPTVQRARILVVDDEEMFADVLAEMLRECGHEVIASNSGSEAIEIFRDGGFDLVFTDLGMPHMSGTQVADAIKEISPETPIALLTGWGAIMDKTELEGSSVDVTLSKPIDLQELSSVVAGALGHAKQA